MSRRYPLAELRPSRIGLIKPSALGDIVHSLPVLHALRVRYPEAHLTWIVNRAFEPLLRGHPELDEVFPFDRQAGIRCVPGFARELLRRRFDLVIDLQGLLRTGLMAAGSLARRRIGLSSARELAAWFYTDVVRVSDNGAMHAVDRYWLVAEALGAGDVPKVFRLPRDAEAEAWAEQQLRFMPRPRFMVAPGSRWVTKRWPVEHFAELLRLGLRATGGSVVLLGTKDEAALTSAIASCDLTAEDAARRGEDRPSSSLGLSASSAVKSVVDLAGNTTLPQLVALLDRADVVIANDSGPMHLAAALGRPVIAPYTCTTIAQHGPYSQNGAVETSVWCRGSYRKRCDRLECMNELTPERLWPKLDEVLRRWRSHCRSA